MFSFLTGKKTDEPEANASASATKERVVASTESQADGFHDTPFVAPEAWNLDALNAPPPPPPPGQESQLGPVDAAVTAELQPKVIEQIKTVFDPEIPVDIYELGLVYEILADADRRVLVKMTLTSPACPSAQQIPSEVRYKVKAIPGVTEAWVEIVWEPPWDKERMSDVAKLQLGFL